MDVMYKYEKDKDYTYSFESNFDLAKLAGVDGVDVVLSGNSEATVQVRLFPPCNIQHSARRSRATYDTLPRLAPTCAGRCAQQTLQPARTG
eukprot:COSAG01_NODE_6181_length_3806_cov_2.435932_5_plen_91_part_00